MESNLCDGNTSDSNVLLPPRKRLLAGFKKRNSDSKSEHPLNTNKNGVFDPRIDGFTKHHLKNPNLSLDEIVEESSRAAREAAKVAVAARAVAEEKAIAADKAMARAKSALELVASISDEMYSQDRHLKRNKMKKHLDVKMYYNKHGNVENCKTDEELARRLHLAMNSSPRITKNSVDSNMTNKHKRMKGLSSVEESRVTSNGHGESEEYETDSEDLIGERQVISIYANSSSSKITNGEGESSHVKKRSLESSHDFSSVGRKRGRMKQKKLPLSICSIRDLANTKEDMRSNGALSIEESVEMNNVGSSYVRTCPDSVMPAKPTSAWKCKAFKAPVCVKQNKVTEP